MIGIFDVLVVSVVAWVQRKEFFAAVNGDRSGRGAQVQQGSGVFKGYGVMVGLEGDPGNAYWRAHGGGANT